MVAAGVNRRNKGIIRFYLLSRNIDTYIYIFRIS